jgi:hypothetical protein
MDANQEAKPRIYTREEFDAEVDLAQGHISNIVQMMPAAAALYAGAYGSAYTSMTDCALAGQVFELATALAERLQQHVALDAARLTQAKQDSRL